MQYDRLRLWLSLFTRPKRVSQVVLHLVSIRFSTLNDWTGLIDTRIQFSISDMIRVLKPNFLPNCMRVHQGKCGPLFQWFQSWTIEITSYYCTGNDLRHLLITCKHINSLFSRVMLTSDQHLSLLSRSEAILWSPHVVDQGRPHPFKINLEAEKQVWRSV